MHHLTTSCVITQDLREQLGQHFEAIMVGGIIPQHMGMVQGERGNQNLPHPRKRSTLRVATPGHDHHKSDNKSNHHHHQWREHAMPHCTAFAIKTQEALQQ